MVDASEERVGAHSEKMLHGFHVTKKYMQNSVKLNCCDVYETCKITYFSLCSPAQLEESKDSNFSCRAS